METDRDWQQEVNPAIPRTGGVRSVELPPVCTASVEEQNLSSKSSPSKVVVASRPCSPTKVLYSAASDTVTHPPLLVRQSSTNLSTGAVPCGNRSKSPSKLVISQETNNIGVSQSSATCTEASNSEISNSESCGLDFLLQACTTLEPTAMSSEHNRQSDFLRPRGAHRKRRSDEIYQSNGEDDEYRPYGRTARGSKSRRSSTATLQGQRSQEQAIRGADSQPVRWERGMVHGPCLNPDCEYPNESPQWRKGPPHAPILCNACGTRWLRNGTLKPLVPRRGIRYGRVRAKKTQQQQPPPPQTAPEVDKESKRASQDHRSNTLDAATEALNSAIASLPELLRNPSAFLDGKTISNPILLQQQLQAMSAVAQAAQKAFAAAAEAAVSRFDQKLEVVSPFASKGNSGAIGSNASVPIGKNSEQRAAKKPVVFNIQAVAGPAVPAPAFIPSPKPLKLPSSTPSTQHIMIT